ncbi:alpha/beta hydrolase [Amycolatopsis sulphurea]|uniref:alpha/beta hydrolase n=1 Tax=Amycolatopsis sulphurea TaxID=76022 RepID=UPI001FE82138|nr:alpha/beta hydrolase [Amycolatopsis sulphurea]
MLEQSRRTPGAGTPHARRRSPRAGPARTPESAYARPFDEAAYAAEPSALAETTLDDAAALLIDQIRAFSGGERVVLVAHSFGGAVAGRATQEIPELIAHLAYVAAVMPAGGRSGAEYLASP